MTRGTPDGEALEARLAYACGVTRALLDEELAGIAPAEPVDDGPGVGAWLASCSALRTFRSQSCRSELTCPAWRTPHGVRCSATPRARPRARGLPTTASAAIEAVERTRARTRVAELEVRVRGRVAYVALMLDPTRGPRGVIAACADVTGAAIARRLGVVPDAPAWTGATPAAADGASPSWHAYTGIASAALWLEMIHVEDRAPCAQALADAVRLRDSTEIVCRLRHAGGEYRWNRVRFASPPPALRWFAAATELAGAAVPDAERSALETERVARFDAELANRQKDQFLARVSHELRGTLSTMQLWDGLLRKDELDPELRRHALDAIHQSVQLQSRLVGDLLDVSRAISGKLHIDRRALDLASVLGAAVETIAPSITEKQIAIETRLDPLLGYITGDAVRIRQVIDNVLANALKFTDRHGRIAVSSRREGRHARDRDRRQRPRDREGAAPAPVRAVQPERRRAHARVRRPRPGAWRSRFSSSRYTAACSRPRASARGSARP